MSNKQIIDIIHKFSMRNYEFMSEQCTGIWMADRSNHNERVKFDTWADAEKFIDKKF